MYFPTRSKTYFAQEVADCAAVVIATLETGSAPVDFVNAVSYDEAIRELNDYHDLLGGTDEVHSAGSDGDSARQLP